MKTFMKAAPWVTRLIVIFPAALFVKIGIQNTTHLKTAVGARGIVFVSGMGMTVGRIGFGAFPLACGFFLVGCILSERSLLTALAFVATLDTVVLVIRVASIFSDSSIQENMGLLRIEVLLLALTGAGVLIELVRKQGTSPMSRMREGVSNWIRDHQTKK